MGQNPVRNPQHVLETFDLTRLHPRWGWLVALGVGALVLGMVAVGYSVLTTLITVTFLGVLLIVGGALIMTHAVVSLRWRGFMLNLLMGLLYAVAGAILVIWPAIGALTLTLFAAAFFLGSGAVRIGIAVAQRFDGWGWAVLSGLVSLALGALIWAQWPLSGLYIIGVFLGIDLFFMGWALLALGWQARRIEG